MTIQPAKRAVGLGLQTVWSTFTPLAVANNAVNLGQGFPDLPVADFVKQAAQDAIAEDSINQYAPSRGRPNLIKALAIDYEADMGRRLTGENVMVTLGANQGIFAALQTFLDTNDTVMLVEPYFDIYKPSIEIVGGRVVCCQLEYTQKEWRLDFVDMERKIEQNRVKVLLINTPHNPTGKIFTIEELNMIAELAKKYNLLVISDEVYDELYYTESRPTRLASLAGMWERTITVGSAGKRFGVTGWRVGWLVGDKPIIDCILAVHSRTVYSAPSPLQEACAKALQVAREKGYFAEMRKLLLGKRDQLVECLEQAGFPCYQPQGGYFIMANSQILSSVTPPGSRQWAEFPFMNEPEDYSRARWMTERAGVACIPPSAFYEHDHLHLARDWLRFCFCKREETLKNAAERLKMLPSISR